MDIIASELGLEITREFVLNDGYESIVELGNNFDSERVSPENIGKVKAFLGTDKDPMWFLDMFEYRWKM